MFMVYIEYNHEQGALVLWLWITSISQTKPICSREG